MQTNQIQINNYIVQLTKLHKLVIQLRDYQRKYYTLKSDNQMYLEKSKQLTAEIDMLLNEININDVDVIVTNHSIENYQVNKKRKQREKEEISDIIKRCKERSQQKEILPLKKKSS